MNTNTCLLFLVSAILTTGLCAEDIEYSAVPVHFDIKADLTPAEGRIEVVAKIRMVAREDGISEIVLGFDEALTASDASDGDGTALKFAEHKDKRYSYVTISYPGETLRSGDTFELNIAYGGVVDKVVSNVNTISAEITELGQALYWYPRELDHSANDYTYSLDITAPEDQTVFVPSHFARLVEKRSEGGKIRWVFESTGNSDWTLILAASNKMKTYSAEKQGISGEIIYFDSSEETISHLFDNIVSILDCYNGHYGMYEQEPFFRYFLSPREGWSYVRGKVPFMPEGHIAGAVEGNGLLRPQTYEYLAHELAHMWWGGTVKPAAEDEHPNSDWLSEGFAEFSSMVATEAFIGAEAARELRQNWLENIVKHNAGPSITKATKEKCEDWQHWRDVTYYKSAFVLSMIRDYLGDANFFEMMRHWFEDNKGSEVTTSQFFEYLSGYGNGTNRYAEQWLLHDDVPEIELSYELTGGDTGCEVIGRVKQKGEIFAFPLQIVLRGGEESETLRLECDRNEIGFRRTLDFEPTTVEVDPDHRVLLRSTVLQNSISTERK